MKKIGIIVVFVTLALSPIKTQAAEGLIKPSSPLYFLQSWGESIRYLFTTTSESRIDYLLQLTDRRVDEIQSNSDNTDLVSKLTTKYEDSYTKVERLSQNTTTKSTVTQKIVADSLRQQEVLAGVYQKVPVAAQAGITTAQENSSKNVAAVVTKVEGEKTATDYQKRAATIQQTGKIGVAPMQSDGPAADPSQTPLRSLNGSRAINSLNTTSGSGGEGNAEQVSPAAPQSQR